MISEACVEICNGILKASEPANYWLTGISVAKLMEFVAALDCEVEVNITPARRHGCIVAHELDPA